MLQLFKTNENNRIDSSFLLQLNALLLHRGNWLWSSSEQKFFWASHDYKNRALPVEIDSEEHVQVNDETIIHISELLRNLSETETCTTNYIVNSPQGPFEINLKARISFNKITNDKEIHGTNICINTKENDTRSLLKYLPEAPHPPESGVLIIDTATNDTYLSDNLRALLGVNKETENLPFSFYLAMIDEDSRHSIKFHNPQNYPTNFLLLDEYNIICKNNRKRNFRSYSRALKNHKQETIIIATIIDISRNKELNIKFQERLSFIDMALDNSVDMICAFDLQLNCIAWNNKCIEVCGFTKSEAIGKHATILFPLLKKEKVIAGLHAALKGEIVKVTIDEAPENQMIIEKFIIPLKGSSGKIFGVMIIGHDITTIKITSNRLKELYQAIKEKNIALEQSNNELASFSYIASHDLQEPLRKIQTFSRKILETDFAFLSEGGKDSFKRMENSARRMQSLINDLLTFSRTNTLPKDYHLTDLNTILYEVKTELREKIDAANVKIISGNLPKCYVIEFQFRQLLENILSNSIKYSRAEVVPEIKITYKILQPNEAPAELANENQHYFQLTITDNGIGFDQQYAEKIFDLFQRLHGRHEYPGTGLGLAICKKIVQNHNGIIYAYGKPGEGSSFTIVIPFRTAREPAGRNYSE